MQNDFLLSARIVFTIMLVTLVGFPSVAGACPCGKIYDDHGWTVETEEFELKTDLRQIYLKNSAGVVKGVSDLLLESILRTEVIGPFVLHDRVLIGFSVGNSVLMGSTLFRIVLGDCASIQWAAEKFLYKRCPLSDDVKLADASGRELAVIKQNYLRTCQETCTVASDLKVLMIRYLFLRTFFYESHLTNDRKMADSLTPGQKFHCTSTLCQVQSSLRFVLGY